MTAKPKYLRSYKDYLIVLLSIISPNLKLIINFEFKNFFQLIIVIILMIVVGLIMTSILALLLNYIVDWFNDNSKTEFPTESKKERLQRILNYFLIVSIINIFIYIISGNSIMDFIF